jgi:hypothetical protein
MFVGLPEKERLRVMQMETICKAIDRQSNKRAAFLAAAQDARGMSEASIRMTYYRWIANNRNLLSLANQKRLAKVTLAKEITQTYKAYAEDNQRSSKAAYDAMLRDIRAGKRMPGVGDWTDMWRATYPTETVPAQCPADFVPGGLTYRNLQRVAGLERYEALASRQGAIAALRAAPSVYSTRVGLPVGAIFEFDDLTHDNIVDAGSVRGVRPQEFACLDVASAYKCAYGVKAEIINDDGSRERLKEREMLYLAAYVLTAIGYRPQGSIWIVEHGTAAIRDALRKIIRTLTRDAVSFQDSGILGEQVHGGLFPGKGQGVPGIKAHLESSFNLVHNVAGSLPAQTGSNSRETKPEQLAGIEKYHQGLLKATAALPEETQRRLMLPVLRLGEFQDALATLYRIIHDRRDHDLEGWDASGNVEHCFRLSPAQPWMSIAGALAAVTDPEKKAALNAAILTLAERKEMRMSPAEVWHRDSGKLTRLDHWATVPLLAGDERCIRRDRLTRKGEICFEDRYFGPGQHRFYPVVATPEGRRELLSSRRDYAFILTPYDTGRIYVLDTDSLSCIGVAERMQPGSRIDLDSMHRLMGKRQEVIGMLNEPIQERHAEDAADRAAMIEHNTAVIADARLGLPAPADQKRMREEEADVEEVLEVGGQRAEVGGQRAEVGGQRSEDGEFADVL